MFSSACLNGSIFSDADATHHEHLFHINQVHNRAVQKYLQGKHHPSEGHHAASDHHLTDEEHHLVLAQLTQHGGVADHGNDHHEAQKKSESSSSSSSSSSESSDSSSSSSESDSESAESLEAKKGHHHGKGVHKNVALVGLIEKCWSLVPTC